ncbi:MAG: hypothetical protein NTV54_14445 [Ignavibacteriales bacterium]|nr:hypothetical protein [Ignavibacteriales bacterium]
MRERKALRLPGHDYSFPGRYFVTICVKDHAEVFGEIVEGKMIFNYYGTIVRECWDALPHHIAGCMLDDFVVMPNHVHGIIIIIDSDVGDSVDNAVDAMDDAADAMNDAVVGNRHACSLPRRRWDRRPGSCSTDDRIGSTNRQHEKLPVIVGSFKSAAAKIIHQTGNTAFRWQKSYYESIIRSADHLNRVRQYIRSNPIQWASKHFKEPFVSNLFFDFIITIMWAL